MVMISNWLQELDALKFYVSQMHRNVVMRLNEEQP